MNIQTVTHGGISFVDVVNPGNTEMKYLRNNYDFDSLHLDDFTNKTQVSKVEVYKKYSLIVLDFPYFTKNGEQKTQNGISKTIAEKIINVPKAAIAPLPIPQFSGSEKKRRIFTSQVAFFIGKNYLVVLHDGNLTQIDEVFSQCQKTLQNRNKYMSEGAVFLAYKIIDVLVDSCFPIINDISSKIDKIDRELEKFQSKKTIEDISLTKRNLVFFQTMIKPMRPMFTQLEEGKYSELNGFMQPYWGNVLDHLIKIWERLEDNRELIEGISMSNESILSYKNNEIVKFLTVITSVAFPFVIINNLYSMNIVGLPLAQDAMIVWILFGIIFLSGTGILIYFKFRDWI
ncbi:MAG: magnesium transporter CorA family protein [Patescibacteria group bacterium]|nr:magnesium transporter CorA family protein [Patescibacteria group bacterium]